MSFWDRWLRQPQRVWLRRAAFQVHLWTGLAIGLYVVMLSVTGSALVYRVELGRYFATPRPAFDEKARRLTSDELRAAAEHEYPGYTITRVGDRISRREPTISISLERGGETKERLFNPYTGEDLGDSLTQGERGLLWLVRLHDDLLLDRPGRWWNGAGGLVVTLLVMAGIIVWWPGVGRWKRSLGVKWGTGWRRFNWDLHSAMGFWLFLFMLMWGVSGFYLGIPEPLTNFVERISDPNGPLGERPGDYVLTWLTRLHFGRWRNAPVLQAIWAVVGLVPAILFVTGVVMWWNRVLRKRPARDLEDEQDASFRPVESYLGPETVINTTRLGSGKIRRFESGPTT